MICNYLSLNYVKFLKYSDIGLLWLLSHRSGSAQTSTSLPMCFVNSIVTLFALVWAVSITLNANA